MNVGQTDKLQAFLDSIPEESPTLENENSEDARIVTSRVLVTPDMAEDWLSRNTHNRPIAQQRVNTFAEDIRKGNWCDTHQGIAFSDTGVLLDGQHRLLAIISAKTPLIMNVSTGVPFASQEAIDGVRPRLAGDVLSLSMGIDHSKMRVAMARQLLFFIKGARSASIPTLKKILNFYETEMDLVLQNKNHFPRLYTASALSAFVVSAVHYPKHTVDFEIKFFGGENLLRNDPAFVLRNYITGAPKSILSGGGTAKDLLFSYVLNALKYHIESTPLMRLPKSTVGLDFFRAKLRQHLAEIRKLI